MGLIKEPKHVDMTTKSEQWKDKELADLKKMCWTLKQKCEV